MQQNSKSQNANVTKQKKTDCKYDKIQTTKTQMWQNTKRQDTNMT